MLILPSWCLFSLVSLRCQALPHFSNQSLKDDTATAAEQLREAESETKALRMMTQRMIFADSTSKISTSKADSTLQIFDALVFWC